MPQTLAHRRDTPRGRGTYPARRYNAAMQRLVRAVQELSMARDLVAIQRIVSTAARELTGCDGATFILRDGDHCHYIDEEANVPLCKGARYPLTMCISGWSILNGRSAVIPDIYADSRIPHEAYRPTFVHSLVMVPIRSMNPVGAIGNYWAKEHLASEEEVELLQTLADSTAIAMENVRVYSELEERVRLRTAALQHANIEIETLSMTDELTGLLNRRGFLMNAGRMLSWSSRRGQRCHLSFIDVDGLKGVNDSLGHESGDQLLADFATVLRNCVAPGDVIGRLGGDEFCVMARRGMDTEEIDWSTELQSACDRFNAQPGRPYALAASVGCIKVDGDDHRSLEELISSADGLMYQRKRARALISRRGEARPHATPLQRERPQRNTATQRQNVARPEMAGLEGSFTV